MSTNERFTYDGLCRIVVDPPTSNHIYSHDVNPLGVLEEVLTNYESIPFQSFPKILEYKYSFDGLIEDLGSSKNSNEINVVVVWEMGDKWRENYKITSLLDTNNLSMRQYHGVTHLATNLNTGQKEMDLIVLSELIEYLNDPIVAQEQQRQKYED